jgi:hypothetical protein
MIMQTKHSSKRVTHCRPSERKVADATPANDNDPSSRVSMQKSESLKITVAVSRWLKFTVDGTGRTAILAATVALTALALLYLYLH